MPFPGLPTIPGRDGDQVKMLEATVTMAAHWMSGSGRPTELFADLKSGAMLLADQGQDADWIGAFAGEHGARIWIWLRAYESAL
jgi:hypothetical protein